MTKKEQLERKKLIKEIKREEKDFASIDRLIYLTQMSFPTLAGVMYSAEQYSASLGLMLATGALSILNYKILKQNLESKQNLVAYKAKKLDNAKIHLNLDEKQNLKDYKNEINTIFLSMQTFGGLCLGLGVLDVFQGDLTQIPVLALGVMNLGFSSLIYSKKIKDLKKFLNSKKKQLDKEPQM